MKWKFAAVTAALLGLTPVARAASDIILCSCVPYDAGPAVADIYSNLFSTTPQSIFELVRPPNGGQWSAATVVNFADCGVAPGCADRQYPLAVDSTGTVFGTAAIGGNFTVFAASAAARMQTIYQDEGGYTPGLTIDPWGNLYGVVLSGGLGYGGVFELSPANGGWQFSLIWPFRSNNAGIVPVPPIYSGGNLYVETPGDIVRLRKEHGQWRGYILAQNPRPVSWQLGHNGGQAAPLYMLTASNQILRLSPQPGQWQSTALRFHPDSPRSDLLAGKRLGGVTGRAEALRQKPPGAVGQSDGL
jgi:hypothetical protein